MEEKNIYIDSTVVTVAIGPGETVTVSAEKGEGSLHIEEWTLKRDAEPPQVYHQAFETPSAFVVNTRDQKTIYWFSRQTP